MSKSRHPIVIRCLVGVFFLAGAYFILSGQLSAIGRLSTIQRQPPTLPSIVVGRSESVPAKGDTPPGKQLEELYPSPQYVGKPSFDPTTAKFFDAVNVDEVKKPGEVLTANGATYQSPGVTLSGYKLNDAELAKFKENGFVVSERLGSYTFGQLYYDIYSRDLPVFITSDSVLHAWHRSYDAMLKQLEVTYLIPSLETILASMHDAIPNAQREYGTGLLKDSILDADYFLAVASSLLKDGFVRTKLNQDKRVRETLVAVAGEGMQEFNLFGRQRAVDFSQFKPRGHYAELAELRGYFKSMMWCGRIDLRIAGGSDATGELSSQRELGASLVLLDLLHRSGKEQVWRQFDRVMQTFIGLADSATFDDLDRIAKRANINAAADVKTQTDLDKLTKLIQQSDIGKQAIVGDVYFSSGNKKVELPRSFTVLGQRFVIDSWATSYLTSGAPAASNPVPRTPRGRDVAFAVLGNSHIAPHIALRVDNSLQAGGDDDTYQQRLVEARKLIDGLDSRLWDETLYMGWLKTLRTLSSSAEPNMPEAMRTRNWAMKQTNTQMASWTQLRHDTILYAKQSYGIDLCYYPAGFVEPVTAFWAQMQAMATRAAVLLEETPFPEAAKFTQTKQTQFLRNFAAQMGTLQAIAQKELAQQELTADETKMLQDVMQIVHSRVGSGQTLQYTGWYPSLFYEGRQDAVKWDALTADVHTNPSDDGNEVPGPILHEAIGNVDLLIIAIDNGKDRVVYLGPTMSQYEFETPNGTRRTDKEWRTQLLDGKLLPERPDYTQGYLVPTADRKPIDPRVKASLLLN